MFKFMLYYFLYFVSFDSFHALHTCWPKRNVLLENSPWFVVKEYLCTYGGCFML
jgi:hypothetical protein